LSAVPGIHVLIANRVKDVDGRDKPGHDAERASIIAGRGQAFRNKRALTASAREDVRAETPVFAG